MSGILSKREKYALADTWVAERMRNNPRWKSNLSNPRTVQIHERATLVAWRMTVDGPAVDDVFRVVDVEVSFTAGVSVVMESQMTREPFVASTHPREIVPGVFVWLPPFAELRFCPFKYDDPNSTWRLALPVSVRDGASGSPVPGEVYLWNRKDFLARWPHINI